MFKKKYFDKSLKAVFLIGLVVLSGCSTDVNPLVITVKNESVKINLNSELNEKELLAKAGVEVSDDTSKLKVDDLKVSGFDSIDFGNEGTTTVELSTSDEAGNSSTASFDVTVEKSEEQIAEEKKQADPKKSEKELAQLSEFDTSSYELVTLDSCSLSGSRHADVKVDIGYDSDYANRDYYGYTNDYGQLVHVEAAKIILQNDDEENTGDDRYCSDEAKVPGTEESDLDEGHVIADSLGGVSNAYNITPQESQLNRHGKQADMEEDIRSSGGATNFVADIEYPNTTTQIPSSYTIKYTVNGTPKSYTADNDYIADGESDNDEVKVPTAPAVKVPTTTDSSVYYKNCTAVRDAGAAPIYKGDAGYDGHLDRDGDGVACE